MSSRSMALLAAQLLAALVFSDATAERLPIRTYTTEEGLAHARVRRIVRDPRGFLWFCTVDGLSRFDGSEFITYRGADGLPDPWVSDLLVARDGTYWVATNDGVVKFAPHLWRAGSRDRGSDGDEAPHLFQDVPLEETPLLSKEIRALLQDRAGRVWAGGLGGLFLLDTSGPAPRFRHVVPSPEAMVTRLLDGADGTLWIGTMGGLFERSLSGRVLAVPSAVGAGVLHVRGLAADLAGRLWVGHDEGLLVLGPSAGRPEHMSASAVRRPRNCGSGHGGQRRLRLPEGDDACIVTVADGLLDRRVRTIEIGSNGHVRVGTVAGLNDFDGVSITRMTAAQGLVDETINAIAEDRDGNVWIGTDSGGVLRVAAFGFVSYFPADGLQIEYTPSLIEGDAGRVIAVAGASFTLSEFDGRRFVPTRFNIPRVMPRDRFFSTLRDHLGAWWLGTPSGLLEYPSPRRLVDLARLQPLVHALGRHELPSDDLFPLFEDERGDIWLSARLPDRLKLLRWRRATDDFQIYGAKDGLADGTARPAVVAGLAGQLFVGFEEAGLFVYRDGRFSAILDGARRMGVMRLHVDRLGRLWIFRTDGAVSRIDDLSGYGVVRDEMVQRSLMGARVRCVVEDARGHLFMGTASGVVEVDPGTGGTWRYTTAEGLAQNEVLSALVSRRGEVWFGTVSGVSRLQAVPPRRTRHVPEVYITTVRVNAGARLVSALGEREVPGLTLEPDERHVSIDYFGLTFAPGEPLQYQVQAGWRGPRLERADAAASRQLRAAVARYLSLPGSGRHAVGHERRRTGEPALPHPGAGLASMVVHHRCRRDRGRSWHDAPSLPRGPAGRDRARPHEDRDGPAR